MIFSRYFSLGFVFMAALSGCSTVTVHDGKVPPALASQIKSIEGNYVGDISLQTSERHVNQSVLKNVTLKVSMDKDGQLQLLSDRDWLGKTCGMSIGPLVDLQKIGKSEPAELDAHFRLDAGKCKDQVESELLLLIARRDPGGETYLETYLKKERITPEHRGNRTSIHYSGHFVRARP